MSMAETHSHAAPRQFGHAEAVAELPARHTPLRHLQQSSARANSVAQAYVMFRPAAAAEVLAKSPRLRQQWMRAQFRGPSGVMLIGVMVNGFLHTAVYAQIALLVTAQAERGHCQWAVLRLFVDGAVRARPGERLRATGKQRIKADAGQTHTATSGLDVHDRSTPHR